MAPVKIIQDHEALLSCFSEYKNTETTQTLLVRWVDSLLPFDYNIGHIPGKFMRLVDYLSRDPEELPPQTSELNNTFVFTQVNTVYRLAKTSAFENSGRKTGKMT